MPRLRRSNLRKLGFTRVRSGRGFSYRASDGSTVTDKAVRKRLNELVIPPAWADVWIATHDNDHIQATGVDAAGRRQYIYHPVWRLHKDREKFARALELAATLPGARGQVTRALRSEGATRERALAAAFRMLDAGSLRIGSERYAADNGSHGLSTLLCAHVSLDGPVISLDFPGKSGQPWHSSIRDADLAAFVEDRWRPEPDARLLTWQDGDTSRELTPEEINEYVRERTGGTFTAKDFRTLRGTVTAATSLARTGPSSTKRAETRAVTAAVKAAAEVLGNTPAVARSSYVDPRVVDKYHAGVTINPERLASAESELVALLS